LNNMILAGASLVALFFVISTLSPVLSDADLPQFGATVFSVNDGSLAQSIGLAPHSVLQSIGGENILRSEDVTRLLRSHLGQTIEMTWLDPSGNKVIKDVTLPSAVEPGKPILGVNAAAVDSKAVLDRYKGAFAQNPLALLLPPTIQPGAVPYSDPMAPNYESSVFGSYIIFAPIANLLFWSWFINFNVGIFNALPIGPLDGGQLYGALIEKKAKSKAVAKNANMLLTLVMVGIVAASLVLPYVPF